MKVKHYNVESQYWDGLYLHSEIRLRSLLSIFNCVEKCLNRKLHLHEYEILMDNC